MRSRGAFLLVGLVSLASFAWPILAHGRTLSVEITARDGIKRGHLQTVTIENLSYLSLERLVVILGAPRENWKSRSIVLKLSGKPVKLTRDQRELEVAGTRLRLGAPPIVHQGEWMVPEEFLNRVLSKVYLAVTVGEPPVRQTAKSNAVTLTDLRFRSYRAFTRVVVEASGPFTHRLDPQIKGEARVVLNGLVVRSKGVQQVNDGLVKSVRLNGSPTQPALRVAFHGKPGDVKTSTLQEPYRLVLDFYRAQGGETEGASPSETQPMRLIVLDAGHGGHDPGAVGSSGLQEKDIALDVTKRLTRLLEEKLRVKVLLTRTGDEFIPLRERTSFANNKRADLFVSIHANAHRVSASEGVETYFLSSEASDNEARQVAALENGVIALEPGSATGNQNSLKSILWDLAQSDFQEESSRVAETILDALTEALRIQNRGVKQAGFYVLGGAAMPAVLVEIGFLTNPKEERKLMDASYREKIAQALFRGLAAYKQRYDQKMRAPQAKEGRE
jgi:N-acetylmuramoyl-L-alanine amidase